MSEQAFPDVHGTEIETLLRERGSDGVIGFIRGFEDRKQRLALWSLAQRRIGNDMLDCDLDDFVDVVEAGIDEALGASEAAPDEDERRKLLDFANVLSYNLSSGLADCWPSDSRPRERRHLETGLEAAELCLRWREELGKGPFPFSIAWWAKGIHLLALGRVDESEDAFSRSLQHAERHVGGHGGSALRDATGDWSVLLALGYAEIARSRASGNRAGFDAVLATIAEAIAARPADADDLQFTADQLRCAQARHGSAAGAGSSRS